MKAQLAREPAVATCSARAGAARKPSSMGDRRSWRPVYGHEIDAVAVVRSHGLQAKLAVGRSDDPLEHEAERVADRLTRAPAPNGAIVRRCACGGVPGPDGLCAACRAKQLGRTMAVGDLTASGRTRGRADAQADTETKVNAVHGGRPLTSAERAFFEPRFGVDFAGVRIHDGAVADEATAAVGALAYTRGTDVVFRSRRARPESSSGRRILAHELTHVVQQGAASRARGADTAILQRLVDCTPARLSLRDCPPREGGEVARAASSPMAVLEVTGPDRGMVVVNFAVGSSTVKPSLAGLIYWQQFVAQMEQQSQLRWEILGLTDCQGSEGTNARLRRQRAEAIFALLPPGAQQVVTSRDAAPVDECMTGNESAADRTMNRSVLIRRAEVGTVIEVDEPEGEQIEGERAKFVCGPDVTNEIATALTGLRSTFAGWSTSDREEACDALDSYPEGEYAWDIVELHNNAWIHQKYRPICATVGATPPCGSTVQVGDQCYTAGAPNYVVFGTMCKLCYDHFRAQSDRSGTYRFSLSTMRSLINLYKGKGPTGLGTPSGNYPESLKWAEAGYAGWTGGSPTPGDRMNCKPICPTKYTGPPFRVHWYPNVVLETTGR